MDAQILVLFIFIVMSSSATEGMKKNLTGTEGGNITLPDLVLERGFISYGGMIIATVNKREFEIVEESYRDKLLWNKDTGLITITGLQRKDSGIYYIDSKEGTIVFTTYQLTVYESVPTPAVTTLSVSSNSCTLLCSVDRATETTLLWYKDQEQLNQSSSALSLPLTVHWQDSSSSYRCVATSPAEEKTVSVNVTASCSGKNNPEETDSRHHKIGIGIGISVLLAGVVILAAFIIKSKHLDKNNRTTRQTQGSVNTEPELHYTEVRRHEGRHSQAEDLTGPSGPANPLTTVYDKLEVHRMLPTDNVYELTADSSY